MRNRDILMIIVAIGGCMFGWFQEGSLLIQRSFVIPTPDSDNLLHTSPRPVVTNLYGDHRPYLVACSRQDTLAIYPTHNARRNFENLFISLQHERQVSLYADIVGIGVGSIKLPKPVDPEEARNNIPWYKALLGLPGDAVVEAAKREPQVIAVVTEDYRLELYDHQLQSLWATTIAQQDESGIVLHHASILILPQRIYEHDTGSVVVRVKVSGANGTEHQLFAAYAGNTGELRWRHMVPDGFSANDGAAGPSTTQEEDSVAVGEGLLMTPESLSEKANTLPWTHFREAVISALPHRYSHPWDQQMEPHIFFHAKNRRKQKSADGGLFLPDGKTGAGTHGAAATTKYKDRRIHVAADDVGVHGELLGLSAERHSHHKKQTNGPHAHKVKHPNVIVFHGKDSLEVLHLYTGRTVTRVGPLKPYTAYHDVNDDFIIDAVSTRFGSHSENKGRFEVNLVEDCSGVITSGAPVAAEKLHEATICDTEGLFNSLSVVGHYMKGDAEVDTPHYDALSLIGSRNVATSTTHATTPIVLQHHEVHGRGLVKVARHAVFMIDTGLMTCVDPKTKRVVWRTQTDATFSDLRAMAAEETSAGLHSQEELDNRVRKFPHLVPYSMHQNQDAQTIIHSVKQRYRETDPFVLAVGETHLAAINARNGAIAEQIALLQPPVAPSLVVDLNGDGQNDVLVFSSAGMYGFIVHRQGATSTVALLMLLMVAALLVLVVAREMSSQQDEDGIDLMSTAPASSSKGHAVRRLKRSTD